MYYLKLQDENIIIEFINSWTGEEIVLVDGTEVSRKYSFLGADHVFFTEKGNERIPYKLSVKIDVHTLGLGGITIDLYKDGQILMENEPVPIRLSGKRKNTYFKTAMKYLQEYDLQDALTEFEKALEQDPDEPEIHFYLACVHSLLENKEAGFSHLEKALSNGLANKAVILENDKLAYLRIQVEFEAFKNKYLSNQE